MRLFLTVILTLLMATNLFAADETAQEKVAEGITLIRAGKYPEAVPILREAVTKDPDDQKAVLQLGIALNRSEGGKEAESLLKQSLMNAPQSAEVNYELGLHYFNKGVNAEAADYFESSAELAPESDLAARSRDHLAKIAEMAKGKSWNLNLSTGVQYDSNVILNGNDMPLPAGYSKKADWNALATLKGSYSPIKTDQTEVTLGYTFYQSLHARLRKFDLTQNLLDLSGEHNLSKYVQVKGAYTFEYVLLDNNRYDHAHTFSPSLVIHTGDDWGSTTLDYRYRNNTYTDSADFADNSQRTGANHYGAISHILSVSSALTVWAQYSHDDDTTRNAFWDYSGNRGLIGLRLRLPYEISADLSGELYDKRYRAGDPAFLLTTRHDTQFTYSVAATKVLSDIFSVTCSETYILNNSNISAFDYDRSLTSLLVNARF